MWQKESCTCSADTNYKGQSFHGESFPIWSIAPSLETSAVSTVGNPFVFHRQLLLQLKPTAMPYPSPSFMIPHHTLEQIHNTWQNSFFNLPIGFSFKPPNLLKLKFPLKGPTTSAHESRGRDHCTHWCHMTELRNHPVIFLAKLTHMQPKSKPRSVSC